MTWLEDVINVLESLGGEARWTELVEETIKYRKEKGEYISPLKHSVNIRINFTLNENRDGNGRDIFTKVSSGLYKLKVPNLEEWQQTIEEYSDEVIDEIEEEELKNGIESKLSKLDNFLEIISTTTANETIAGNFLKDNPWIFGLEYLKTIPEEKIGLNGRTDFLLEGIDGNFNIVELKGPNENIFIKSVEQNFFRWSATCKDAVSQMMFYLSKYDTLYLFQKEETKRDVLYPNGIIIIGRNKDENQKPLSIHNNFINRMQILTYDHIIESCRQSLKNINKEYLDK